MGRHFQKGFTIIETMLVLAITGVLVAGLLVGLGSSIGAQRYKDAVSTLKAQVQSQYLQIDNVTNDRDDSWTCGASAQPTQSGAGVSPGQTDCVVLGRYMSIVGSNTTTATVIGHAPAGSKGANDLATLIDYYTLGISSSSVEKSTLEWGSEISWPVAGSDSRSGDTGTRAITILIIRSPDSGTTYTFTGDTAVEIDSVSSDFLKTLLVGSTQVVPGQMARTLCVAPGGVNVPEKLGVYISPAANGSSSIEVRTDAVTKSLDGDTKCN